MHLGEVFTLFRYPVPLFWGFPSVAKRTLCTLVVFLPIQPDGQFTQPTQCWRLHRCCLYYSCFTVEKLGKREIHLFPVLLWSISAVSFCFVCFCFWVPGSPDWPWTPYAAFGDPGTFDFPASTFQVLGLHLVCTVLGTEPSTVFMLATLLCSRMTSPLSVILLYLKDFNFQPVLMAHTFNSST